MESVGLALLPALVLYFMGCGISGGGGGDDELPKADLEIRDVQVQDVSDSSAVVAWGTTQDAIGTVSYGTDQALASFSTKPSGSLGTAHSVRLGPLEEDTEYWYRISASNPLGERSSTEPSMFRTLISADAFDSTAPVIRDIRVAGITPNSATVLWSTDDRTNGTLLYGFTSTYGEVSNETEGAYARSHSLALSGLTEDEEYHFLVRATNRAGLSSTSGDNVFRTARSPSLFISPAEINVVGNTEFTFRLSVESVTNLAGLEFTIIYDPGMIEILSVRPGPLYENAGGFLFIKKVPGSDNPIQYDVSWNIVYENGLPVGTLANGDGDVAVIRARTKGLATRSDLIIDNRPGGDGTANSRLLDHNRSPIAFNVRNGRVVKSG